MVIRPAPKPVPIVKPVPKPKSLKQQNTDFTAEGAPPPGKVDATVPETTDKL